MTLITWSWLFLVIYIGGMITIGVVAQRRVKHADDFATARGAYGPLFLALAFSATTVSGATFLGMPGLSYTWGITTMWGVFLGPAGLCLGMLLTMRLITSSGHKFGNRSIPEYLGDRYQSEGIRVLVSLFSLLLCFYLAGQLVSGLVMFEILLGLPPLWALIITTTVLLIYVVLGGAHADIIADGIQACLMLLVAVVVVVLFLIGFGLEVGESGRSGFLGLIDNLATQDEHLVSTLNTKTPLYHSWWSIVSLVISFIPLGVLPHLGNKLWALKHSMHQNRFLTLTTIFIITLAMLTLGGLLARALLGDASVRRGRNLESRPADTLHRAVSDLVGGLGRCRHPGRHYVHRGRTRRVLLPDYRQRPLPSEYRPAIEASANRGTTRPPGLIHQPGSNRCRVGRLRGNSLVVG